MTLLSDEFIRRFLLHVLSSGFHRIRHYGLLANAARRLNVARARELLDASQGANAPSQPETTATPLEPPRTGANSTYLCPHCAVAMLIIETLLRAQPIRAPPRPRGIA